jgi:hypothetical protein
VSLTGARGAYDGERMSAALAGDLHEGSRRVLPPDLAAITNAF